MPSLTAQASTFRTSRHQFRAFLSYLPQTVVLRALVNGTPSTWPAKSVTVDNITVGSVSAVRENQTVRVLDGSGNLRGICRVANGAGSGAVLQISETSQGYINITDNDTIEVINEYRIFEKLVEASAALRKDSRITYTDQGSNPPPVANCGGLWAGFLDSGQTYATVTFDASVSYVIDPDSGGTLTYLWDVGDGTITVGSTTTAAITVRFPAGWRHVTLTVTDAGNSKSTVRYVPVWVHDPDSSDSDYPKSVMLDSRSYTEEGWTPQFRLPVGSEADLDNLPDGSLVVIWEDNRYGSTQANYGSNVSGRSHIKFVGYLDRDQISLDADDDDVLFTAISPLGVLAKTGALPQLTIQKAAPANWQGLKSNSVFRTLWYLWHWHNTAFTYFDMVRPASGDLGYTRLATTVTSNQLDQFKDIAGSMGLTVTCDWLGRLILDFAPNLQDMTARGTRTTAYDFTTADAVRIEWENEHHSDIKVVKGEGITDGTTTAANKSVYALYPGHAPALLASGVATLDRQIVNNQAEMNERTVLEGARLNGIYYGRKVPKGLRLTLRGGYDVIDPALQEWVTITLPASSNRRGVAFTSSTRWLVKAAEVVYDSELGSKEVVYTLDHETFLDYDTFDADDITDVRPPPESSNLPGFNPPGLDFPGLDLPPFDVGNPIEGGTGTIAAFTESGLWITTNFNTPEAAGGPTWTEYSYASLSINGVGEDAIVDPFSPLITGAGSTVDAYLVTTTRIYLIEDIFGTRTVTSQHTFTTAITKANFENRAIEASRGVEGLLCVTTNYADHAGKTGQWAITTTDGATWGTELQISSTGNTAFWEVAGVYVGRTGTIYTSAQTGSASTTPAFTGRKSTNSGVSFSAFSNPRVAGFGLGGWMHFPWHDNAAESVVFYSSANDTGDVRTLYRANGTTRTDITPTDGTYDMNSAYQRSIHTPDNNRNRVALAGIARPFTGEFSNNRHAVFLSDDAGANWTQVTGTVASTSPHYVGISVTESGYVYAWGDSLLGVGGWNDLLLGNGFDNRYGNITAGQLVLNIIGG